MPHILVSPWCLHFIYNIITQRYICKRKYWNIYFPVFPSCCVSYWNEPHCETANQSRAQQWATLWNSQSEQSSTLSRTVKQPIKAELNIIIHDEWIKTLPNKVITDHFILRTNPRVVNGHVSLLETCCPYLSHIHSMLIREQFKILYQCILWHL